MAAEGNSGNAAARCFSELTQSAGELVQRVRARISPPDTKSTWLGPSSMLSDAVAGSVLICESSADGSFVAVVPPKVPSSSPVRRLRGVVSIRVSRDGSLSTARYEELLSLHDIVRSIVPGVLSMGAHKGALADTVRLDANGRALNDLVSPPPHLARIPVGTAQTAAIGATPSHPCSRVAVHCRIAIYESRRLGWAVSDAKTMCGDGVVLLGAQLDTVVARIRCPLIKRRWIVHAAQLIRDRLATDTCVDTALMARFTGRLTNLSQFFPELRLPMSVGYAISRVTWLSGDGFRRRPLRYVHLRRGGRREEELQTLLAVAEDVAEDDWGVPLAPVRCFPAYDAPTSLTLLTDASRADADDGVGGFGFLPSVPGVVFVLSVAWPADIKTALDRGAERRAARRAYPLGTPMLSLPAAEVFGSVALAAAVTAAVPDEVVAAVIAVGDCGPAATAISRLYSKSAQIRHLLAESRVVSRSWLGVSIPREWNSDADRLSHPSMAKDVAHDASAVGLRVVWVTPPEWVFDALRAASRLPMGTDDAEWRP
mmetsp:Transcript_35760/g.86828  ORF Transcript_35760/g.86828 Transcript_35760/m.86828 type:complete len:541 (-) Transcript_35760:1988-3610(-)